MHLREVQMENFKSFKGRLSVPFEPGFTAITGPNGAGKSNIGDAILFVLGPNSPRAMRAQNLSQLIYNGGEKGKAADACAVSLVFDNADRILPVEADMVTLTRRVRLAEGAEKKGKGDEGVYSYFYVNGRASQKKEFVDILHHAGISADGYNITLQGDVQNICNTTPQKRREILDDIAGVTTFDNDLRQADARKADVMGNLERINIVLEEITRALSQLDKEKASAQKYRDLQDSIKRSKGLMAMRRRDAAQAEIAAANQRIQNFTAEREKLGQQVQALKEKQDEVQKRFAELEQRIRDEGGEDAAQLSEKIKAARDLMVRTEAEINFARTSLDEAREASQPLAEELRRAEKELERNRRIQGECAAEQQKTSKSLEAKKKELDQLRESISKSDSGAMQVNKDLVQLKVEHEAKQLELHQAKLESDRTAERLSAVAKTLAEAETQREAAATDLKETSWQLKELEKAGGGAEKKRREAQTRLLELRKEQAEHARQAEELEARIRRLQRELSELRAAEEAAARAQGGYGRAVQDILEARDKREIKGIIGTVAELAKVDKKYQNAMQIAAAGRLTAVVVDDDAVAQSCIELLKKKQSGRVTFLPLSKMVPGRPSGQALMKVKEQGCLGFALDLIEFNPRYQNAFWHVFQDTLMADTMATGRRMMGGVRIVTLDGELFEKSGAISGGNSAKGKRGDDGVTFSNADRGRVDELLAEVATAEAAQQDALAKVNQARSELEDLQTRLAADGAQVGSQGDRMKDLEKKVAVLTERLEALAAEAETLGGERKTLETTATKLAKTAADLTTRLAELEKLRVEKGQLLLKGTRKDLKERVEALEAEIRDLTEASLKAENRRDVAATQLQLVEAARAEKASAAKDKSAATERFTADIARLQKAHAKAKAEVEALMKMERKATGALKGLQESKDKAYRDLVDLEARMTKVQERMETHFGLITNAKAGLPSMEEALGEAIVELKENPVTLKAGEEIPPLDDLKRELRNQEASLDRLGPVNMTALEQYDAQSARKGELAAEVARLEQQKADLSTLVGEIQVKKRATFMGVYTAVGAHFTEVYRIISKGGDANLALENDADPFAGGLIIRAQPPGKKVTRIDSLSGGEKSLTSMAFIFAIQRHQPSPFYYFDEVDQNLDAVNSELLSKMIRDNARVAQFIVVSLRKITLRQASHIYGVTQQEAGQSEIIAHFDLDTLPDEDQKAAGAGKGGTGGPGGSGGADVIDGHDGEGGAPLATKRKSKAKGKPTKETTLSDLTKKMQTVEVKA
jgi:chromosome segregation protein